MTDVKIRAPGRMVDIGGGQLHVDMRGNGRPVVVLESGIAASSVSWSLVHDRIAEFTTVVSYDRAGFGWSRAAPHCATALDAARELARMLEAAGLESPFVLVGHSFGGLIVRIFEQSFPERIAGLVLADPGCAARMDWRERGAETDAGARRHPITARRAAGPDGRGATRLAIAHERVSANGSCKFLAKASAGRGASVTVRLSGEVRILPRELWPVVAAHWSEARCFEAMADSLENLPVSVTQINENLSLADLPVIVLSAATAGAIATAEHERDARLSTRGEHIVIPAAGHWLQLDAPDAVVDAVRRVVAVSRATFRATTEGSRGELR